MKSNVKDILIKVGIGIIAVVVLFYFVLFLTR